MSRIRVLLVFVWIHLDRVITFQILPIIVSHWLNDVTSLILRVLAHWTTCPILWHSLALLTPSRSIIFKYLLPNRGNFDGMGFRVLRWTVNFWVSLWIGVKLGRGVFWGCIVYLKRVWPGFGVGVDSGKNNRPGKQNKGLGFCFGYGLWGLNKFKGPVVV